MIVVKIVVGYLVVAFPLAAIVGRALHDAADASSAEPPECGFASVSPVTATQLDADDQGALEPEEIGWRGQCHCGWVSRVRYSRVSAKSAVAAHVLGVTS